MTRPFREHALRHLRVLLIAGAAYPGAAVAQAPARDSTRAAAQPARVPGPEVSGVLWLIYQRGGNPAERRAEANRFDVDRAYLTVRGPLGDATSFRLTADVYQQRDSTRDGYYRGWAVRAKYAYMQHEIVRDGPVRLGARAGMLQGVIIEHEEGFWPRWITNTAIEQAGFFSSADVGVALTGALADRKAELYAVAVNGPGYTSRETDRFKDFGARLTLTPLAGRSGMLGTLAVSPWVYKGWRASDYARGQGTLEPVLAGQQRDRYGIHAGVKTPRLTLGAQVARRLDAVESADTTVDAAPTVVERTGTVLSAYTVARPVAWIRGTETSPFQVVLRLDRFQPTSASSAAVRNVIAGLGWELSRRASLYLDYQDMEPRGAAGASSDTRLLTARAVVSY